MSEVIVWQVARRRGAGLRGRWFGSVVGACTATRPLDRERRTVGRSLGLAPTCRPAFRVLIGGLPVVVARPDDAAVDIDGVEACSLRTAGISAVCSTTVHCGGRPDGIHAPGSPFAARCSARAATLRCIPPNTKPWNGHTAHQ